MKLLILMTATVLSALAQGQETATVTVYRTSAGNLWHQMYRCDNARYKIEVFDSFTRLTKMARGYFATVQLSAGHHTLRTKTDVVEIDLRPGEQYFLRPRIECSKKPIPPKRLELVSCTDALPELADLVAVDGKDMGTLKGQDKAPTTCSSPEPLVPNAALPTTGETLLKVSSSPSGAEIEIDGSFVGNSPSSIHLPPGDHQLVIRKAGFKTWRRILKTSGGEVNVNADLEREAEPLAK